MASTGPSPIAASCTISPSGRRIATVAVGKTLVPAVVCRLTSCQGAGPVLVVLLDQDRQVLVVDFLLLVGQGLEVVEEGLELLLVQGKAQLGHPVAEGVAAGVLAQDQVGAGNADVLGPHDLVGRPFLEHAVLVDARFVGERVAADDRLVALHRQAGDRRDHPADGVKPLGLDSGGQAEVVVPGLRAP